MSARLPPIPPVPLPNTYWVLPGRFLAGEYPARGSDFENRRRLTALLLAGIETFVNLTWPGELPPYDNLLNEEALLLEKTVTCLRFPIPDFDTPTADRMRATLDALDAALANGHHIYLHCWGGVGRTGTVVGCYLVRHGLSGEQALRQLAEWWQTVPKRSLHPRSPETEAQRQFVLTWHELA